MRCFRSFDGLCLEADEWAGGKNRTVLLAHGGGQTRQAWKGTAERLSGEGWPVVSLDLRGHGESEWATDENYSVEAFSGDLLSVVSELEEPPIIVGASLGGIAAMFAQAQAPPGETPFSALVLVDITPTIRPEGVAKIRTFMRQHLAEGFDSLEEASRVISEYMPHREQPRDLSGLAKVLRKGPDGRFRWHWDPKFATGGMTPGKNRERHEQHLKELASGLSQLPVLLVRGRMSELVSEEDASRFLELVPHASYVDVSGAAHMVAGDRNDVFADALLEFVREVDLSKSP